MQDALGALWGLLSQSGRRGMGASQKVSSYTCTSQGLRIMKKTKKKYNNHAFPPSTTTTSTPKADRD
jgi:hypothetical protein